MKSKRILIPAFAILLAASTTQAAVTAVWGAQSVGAEMQAADGTVLNTTNHTFELGIFNDTFIPTLENAADWRENWIVVGSDPGEAGEGVLQSLGVSQTEFPPGSGNIANTAGQAVVFGNANSGEVNTGTGTNLPEGAKLYVWGFRNDQMDYTPGVGEIPEWLLLSNNTNATHDGSAGWGENNNLIESDNWVVPSAGTQSHNPTNINLSTATANERIAGTNLGGTNPGDILRFQQVPEPSTGFSLLLGLGLLTLRRKRLS